MNLTRQRSFEYANRSASHHEASGKGTVYRQATKRFRTTLDEIEQAIEDYRGEGYLGQGVALGISGHGSRVVEAYT